MRYYLLPRYDNTVRYPTELNIYENNLIKDIDLFFKNLKNLRVC